MGKHANLKEIIEYKKKSLDALKKKHLELISNIREYVYDRDYNSVNEKKRIPSGDKSIMQAAYYYATEKTPRKYDLISLTRGSVWKSSPTVYLDYWTAHLDEFKDFWGSTPAVVFFKKKDIKKNDVCAKIWMSQVENRKTVLGLVDWVKSTSEDKILELMQDSKNIFCDVVTCRDLGIKDIVIVYPVEPSHFKHRTL